MYKNSHQSNGQLFKCFSSSGVKNRPSVVGFFCCCCFGADLNYWTRDGFSCAGLRRSLPPSRHRAHTLTSLALRQVPVKSHSLHHPTQSAVLLHIGFVPIMCSGLKDSIDIVIPAPVFWLVTKGTPFVRLFVLDASHSLIFTVWPQRVFVFYCSREI